VRTVLDSNAWIELFVEGPAADRCAPYARDTRQLVTPVIVLYEVYKKIRRERGEEAALTAVASLRATAVVPLDETLAIQAADVSLRHGLAMADAIVYATARANSARVVTRDVDLKDLPNVVYVA
jgi:predicted nucleic acid-binding protein